MIEITSDPIEIQRVFEAVQSDDAGATVLFTGTTRKWTGEKETVRLEYECYREMAISEIQKLVNQSFEKWSVISIAVVHRVGVVNVGEISIAIAVSSAHRDNAFKAGQWLIDTLKQVVPIWKKENWADGNAEWIHPGANKPKMGDTDQTTQGSDQRKTCP